MKLLAYAFCIFMVAGCCSTPEINSAVTEFRRKHPSEFSKYTYLYPISLNTYKAIWGERAGSVNHILNETERRFGHAPGVKEFVKNMLKQEAEDRQTVIEFCRDLEDASSGGGAICQYEWSDGKTTETGFLVLKSGEIVKREPWITDYQKNDE